MAAIDQPEPREWGTDGVHTVPYWLYSDPEIYRREMARIFCGRSWAYVALAAEVPEPGDYKRSWVGDRSIVVTRDAEGGINAFRPGHGIRFHDNGWHGFERD